MTQQKKKKQNHILSKTDRTAVFIDAANLEKSVADLGTKPPNIKHLRKDFYWKALPRNYYRVDYKKLYKYFKTNTKLASISFYSARFETEPHDKFLTFLKYNGYRLVTKLVKKISISATTHLRKANFDVEIAVDAVDWLKNYDTLVLFSGYSDFAYLLRYLKRRDKKILVISERGHVSNELVKGSDVYLDLHTFKNNFIVPKTQESRH